MNVLKLVIFQISDVDEISFGTDIYALIREVYLKPALKDENRLEFLVKDIERIKSFLNQENKLRELTGFKGKVNFLDITCVILQAHITRQVLKVH